MGAVKITNSSGGGKTDAYSTVNRWNSIIITVKSTEMIKEALREATDELGNRISPVLPSSVKNFLIDIDGTVGEDIPNEEPHRMVTAHAFPDAIEQINKWYDEGHIITFFTSRTSDLKEITETWLNEKGFRYHAVLYGKPRGGNYHWIDNHIVRATRFSGKFTELVRSTHTIEVFRHE
jgi:hypothetical protein